MRTTTLFVIGAAILISGFAATQPPVPRAEVRNPIEGFSIEIPEDWEMASGTAGNVEIAIDAPVGATLRAQPALWFFYTEKPPERTAGELAKSLQLLSVTGAAPTVRATGNGDEWEIVYTSDGTRGSIAERWLCRLEGGMSYVIGAMAKPPVFEAFSADIDHALRSCRLIPCPALHYFAEPREDAYRLTLPEGWRWTGEILRTQAVPGYFVWDVRSPDELTGAFSSPPGVLNIQVPYTPPRQLAGSIILQELGRQLPDVRLETIHELPRVGAYFRDGIKATLGGNPRVDQVRADYIGTRNGAQVRCRATIATFMLDASPMLGGRGNWFLLVSGGWAPADRFDELWPVARGVLASLWTNPEWRDNQFKAVNDVLGPRRDHMWHWSEEWRALICGNERKWDPDNNDWQEVPNRDGGVWKDPDGKMHRVPHNEERERELGDEGWRRIEE